MFTDFFITMGLIFFYGTSYLVIGLCTVILVSIIDKHAPDNMADLGSAVVFWPVVWVIIFVLSVFYVLTYVIIQPIGYTAKYIINKIEEWGNA